MGCASSKVLKVEDLERKICDKETKREMFFSYQVVIVRRPESVNPDKDFATFVLKNGTIMFYDIDGKKKFMEFEFPLDSVTLVEETKEPVTNLVTDNLMQYQVVRIFFQCDVDGLSEKTYKEVLKFSNTLPDKRRYFILCSIPQKDIVYTKCPLFYTVFNYWHDMCIKRSLNYLPINVPDEEIKDLYVRFTKLTEMIISERSINERIKLLFVLADYCYTFHKIKIYFFHNVTFWKFLLSQIRTYPPPQVNGHIYLTYIYSLLWCIYCVLFESSNIPGRYTILLPLTNSHLYIQDSITRYYKLEYESEEDDLLLDKISHVQVALFIMFDDILHQKFIETGTVTSDIISMFDIMKGTKEQKIEFVERVAMYVKRAMKYVHLLPKILEVYQKDAEYMQSTLPTGEPPPDIRLSPKNEVNRRKSSIIDVNKVKNDVELPVRNDIENIQSNDNSKPLFPQPTPIKPPTHPSINNSNSFPTINTNISRNGSDNKRYNPGITVQTTNMDDNPLVKSLFTSKYNNGVKSDDLLLSRTITPQCSDSSFKDYHSMSSFTRREVSSMSPLPYSPQVKVKKILETPSNSQKKLALYNNRKTAGIFSPIKPSNRKSEVKVFDYGDGDDDDDDIQRMKSPFLSPGSDPSPNDDFDDNKNIRKYVTRFKPSDFAQKKEEIRQKQLQQQQKKQPYQPLDEQNQSQLQTQKEQQNKQQIQITKSSKRPPPLIIEENKQTEEPKIVKDLYATCTPKQLHEMENLLLADQYYWMANYFYLLSETMIDGDEDVLKYFQFHLPELQWQWKFMDYIPSRLKNNNEFTSLIFNSLKKIAKYFERMKAYHLPINFTPDVTGSSISIYNCNPRSENDIKSYQLIEDEPEKVNEQDVLQKSRRYFNKCKMQLGYERTKKLDCDILGYSKMLLEKVEKAKTLYLATQEMAGLRTPSKAPVTKFDPVFEVKNTKPEKTKYERYPASKRRPLVTDIES